jgi:hypothetical protein
MVKLIVSLAILFGGGAIVNQLFGNGWPLWIFLIIGGFIWFSVNNELFKKFGG